ncbi:MAG: hypothetical protein J6I73_00110 [Treponema sp.]|nr:hypothetical protein [Treponema sp.]
MKRIIAAISLLLLAAFFCFAQAPLPRGYGGIELGMTLDEVKEKLKKNSEFGYHGDRDVSLLPGENRVLIETDTAAGHVNSFLERCYFQFYNEKLYIIIINVNRERMDHYSIFSTLCEKYGNPSSLSPEKSEWRTDSITMTLERPLALKYVDNNVFGEVNAASLVPLSGTEMTREMFLDEL